MRKIIALLLIALTTFAFPASALARDNGHGHSDQDKQTVTNSVYEDDEDKDVDEDDQSVSDSVYENEGNHGDKPWKVAKEELRKERETIRAERQQVTAELENLEKQLEEATAAGDTAKIDELKKQIAELKAKMDTYKAEMKSKITEMKAIMKAKYTAKELKDLQLVAQTLNKLSGVKTLPVENVVSDSADPKFDTPPVIKNGRTLLPIRAISESMGATVTWDQTKNTATITKDDKEIVFDFNTNKVYVNGQVATIDVPAQILNKRTMVPLRFIATNLGLNVQWDQDTQTIEVE